MKFGIRLPSFVLKDGTVSPSQIFDYVRSIEELGYDSIFLIDHLRTAGPTYPVTWYDSIAMLSAIASVTKRVRFGTLVLVLPLYNPVVLAKSLSTIDYLSNGRLIAGLGVGWNPEEFGAVGVPISSRGKIMDEAMEVLKDLWTGDDVTFKGKFFNLSGVTIEPKPVQRPHPPIWIGGGNQPFAKLYGVKASDVSPALKRIARYASGWSFHLNSPAEMITQDWNAIMGFARQFGRDPREIQIVYSNFIYVTKTNDDTERCRRALSRFTTEQFEESRRKYLIGTADEITDRLTKAIQTTGRIDHAVLNPLDWDARQIQSIRDSILPGLA